MLLTPFLWLGGLGVYHEDVPLKKAATVYYMRHRYYDAAQRRFISPDPTSFSDLVARQELLNLFAYARNNPVSYVDPAGSFGIPGLILGAISGATAGGITAYSRDGWGGVARGVVIGGLAGAAVGVIMPSASSAAGVAAVGALTAASGSYLAQVAVNIDVGQPVTRALRDVNPGMIAGAAVGGVFTGPLTSVFVSQVPVGGGAESLAHGIAAVATGMAAASGELYGQITYDRISSTFTSPPRDSRIGHLQEGAQYWTPATDPTSMIGAFK